jgi:hypothetical protein
MYGGLIDYEFILYNPLFYSSYSPPKLRRSLNKSYIAMNHVIKNDI